MKRFNKINFIGLSIFLFSLYSIGYTQNTQWITYDCFNTILPKDDSYGTLNNNCSEISRISIDKYNNKWIGTGEGFLLFDGISWSLYDVSNVPFDTLGPTGDDILSFLTYDDVFQCHWIGTGYGLLQWSYNGTWTYWDSDHPSGCPLGDETIWSMMQDKNGDVWAATNVMLYKYDGVIYSCGWTPEHTSWYNPCIDASGILPDITQDKNGKIWVGAYGHDGIYTYDFQNCEHFTNSNSGLPDATVNRIIFDKNNNAWIGTSAGLVFFDGINWELYNTSNSQIPSNVVKDIAIDSSNNIWIATDGDIYDHGGMAKFDGANWTIYDLNNSEIEDYTIYSIVIDMHNNKWIGTKGEGLKVFNENGIDTNTFLSKIKDVKEEINQVQLFPNPANDQIIFQFPSINLVPATIEILEYTGKIVLTKEATSTEVSINSQHLASGIYFARIRQRNSFQIQKIIIE